MHDERKVKGEPDEKLKEQTRQLIAKFREVYADVFKHKAEGYLGDDVIKKIDALLELNPELYSVFNYRRQILLHRWEVAERQEREETEKKAKQAEKGEPETASSEGGAAAAAPTFVSAKAKQLEDMEREIKLNTKILMKDYKIYNAWLHRRWLFLRMEPEMKALFLAKERHQCETLLSVDERNFHAWGYRRWVLNEQRRLTKEKAEDEAKAKCEALSDSDNSALSAIAASKEVSDAHNTAERTFTLAKIERNISNFSAWHNRALIFVERLASVGLVDPALLTGVGRSGVVNTLATSELAEDAIATVGDDAIADIELAVRAFFNDPDDQSTWLYAERLVALLTFASQKLRTPHGEAVVAAKVGASDTGDEDTPTSCSWEAPVDLLDPSKGSRTLTASHDAAIYLEECVDSILTDLAECCEALRAESLRGAPSITKGLKGFQWPTWLLLHLPSVVTDSERRKTLWNELAVVDPQRSGYYHDMAFAEGNV